MKILLIGNYLPDQQESMLRLAGMLYQGIIEHGHSVRLLQPPVVCGRIHPSRFGFGKWLGYIDKFAIFPRHIKRELAWADLVHICDHSNAMYIKYVQNIPHLVTCCDLLAIRSAYGEFPQNHVSWTGYCLQRWILNWLRHTKFSACISNATQNDLLKWTTLTKEHTQTIYLGLNYPYHPIEKKLAWEKLLCYELTPETPFFLHVGGTQWYKNLEGLFQIFAYLNEPNCTLQQHSSNSQSNGQNKPFYLIMVGKPFTKKIVDILVCDPILRSRIKILYSIDNDTLQALYNCANCLIFPSWIEGFGWPVLEAMACGCPVFTSNRAPMTEIGGSAAVYFDPQQPFYAAQLILQHQNNLNLMSQLGLEQAKKFSLEDMLKNYISLYQHILETW